MVSVFRHRNTPRPLQVKAPIYRFSCCSVLSFPLPTLANARLPQTTVAELTATRILLPLRWLSASNWSLGRAKMMHLPSAANPNLYSQRSFLQYPDSLIHPLSIEQRLREAFLGEHESCTGMREARTAVGSWELVESWSSSRVDWKARFFVALAHLRLLRRRIRELALTTFVAVGFGVVLCWAVWVKVSLFWFHQGTERTRWTCWRFVVRFGNMERWLFIYFHAWNGYSNANIVLMFLLGYILKNTTKV